MKNIDLYQIIKKPLKIAYKPPKSEWNKYLDNNGDYNPKEKIEIKALKGYTDIYLGKLQRSKTYFMTKERVSYLESRGLVERCN